MRQDLVVDVKNISDAGTHWIVPYNTKEYLETDNPVHSLIGSEPLFISKTTGKHDNDFDPEISFTYVN